MAKPYDVVRFTGTDEEISEQWHKARIGGIGGSDTAAICGLSPYKSPLDVWLVKTGREVEPDLSNKESVDWGNRLESVVADKFAENHPELKVQRRNAMMVSKKRPWAFANIDRWVTDGNGNIGVLEIKTAGAFRADDWEKGVPIYYLTQVLHYMSVTGWQYAYVAVLIGGQQYREYRIERDNDDITALDKTVDNFWLNYVQKDIMPGTVGGAAESDALMRMFGNHDEDLVEVENNDTVERLIDERARIDSQLTQLKDSKSKVDDTLKKLIGEHKGIKTSAHKVTWVRGTSVSVDMDALKLEAPDLVAKHTVQKPRNGGLRVSILK